MYAQPRDLGPRSARASARVRTLQQQQQQQQQQLLLLLLQRLRLLLLLLLLQRRRRRRLLLLLLQRLQQSVCLCYRHEGVCVRESVTATRE